MPECEDADGWSAFARLLRNPRTWPGGLRASWRRSGDELRRLWARADRLIVYAVVDDALRPDVLLGDSSYIEVARLPELEIMRYKVRTDDVTVGTLWRGQTKQFEVSPGPHYVQVTTAWWGWYKSRRIRVDTAPGQVRRLQCVGDFGEPGAATPPREAIILTVARRPTALGTDKPDRTPLR
jgi:hypothetical protein